MKTAYDILLKKSITHYRVNMSFDDFIENIPEKDFKLLLINFFKSCDYQTDLLFNAAETCLDSYFEENNVASEVYLGEHMREEYHLFSVEVHVKDLFKKIKPAVLHDLEEIYDYCAVWFKENINF